jgi:transcription elongation factor Elf1
MTIGKIEHEFTRYITCPYCGSEDEDSWEQGKDINDGSLGIIECDKCGKKFSARRDVDVTYSTENWEPKEDVKRMNDQTKCGRWCKRCGLIEIIRPFEKKMPDCFVCGTNDWSEVTLQIKGSNND